MVRLVQNQVMNKETFHKEAENYLFMTKSKDFPTGDILFQLVYDNGHCVESSSFEIYVNVRPLLVHHLKRNHGNSR